MRALKLMLFSMAITVSIAQTSNAQAWKDSPKNWENSPNNWENSSKNWKNNPKNWENSPNRYGNDRIVRDENGNPTGYAVPKEGGGSNIYDFSGKRKGYVPDPE